MALIGLPALVSVQAQTVPLVQDASVVPNSVTNYGIASTLNVGGPSGGQALLQFDLSTLPANIGSANVAKATLTVFVNKLGATGFVNFSVANGLWFEQAVNGTNSPTPAAAVASGVPVSSANSYVYVDATQAVQNWLSGAAANNGFIISPSGSSVNVALDSKESTTTSHPATLTLILTSGGAVGGTGATGATGPVGATGQNGLNGATGATGSVGQPGTPGVNGSNGTTGSTGATGPAGPSGTAGIFGTAPSIAPSQSGTSGAECTVGEIILSASAIYPVNWTPADGRLLSIGLNPAVYVLLSNNFGGDGRTTFALPDLRAAAPNKTAYYVCTTGVFP